MSENKRCIFTVQKYLINARQFHLLSEQLLYTDRIFLSSTTPDFSYSSLNSDFFCQSKFYSHRFTLLNSLINFSNLHCLKNLGDPLPSFSGNIPIFIAKSFSGTIWEREEKTIIIKDNLSLQLHLGRSQHFTVLVQCNLKY